MAESLWFYTDILASGGRWLELSDTLRSGDWERFGAYRVVPVRLRKDSWPIHRRQQYLRLSNGVELRPSSDAPFDIEQFRDVFHLTEEMIEWMQARDLHCVDTWSRAWLANKTVWCPEQIVYSSPELHAAMQQALQEFDAQGGKIVRQIKDNIFAYRVGYAYNYRELLNHLDFVGHL